MAEVKRIKCQGITAYVQEFYDIDIHIDKKYPEYSHINVEFRDTKGKYRSYKSYFDHGEILMDDGTLYSVSEEGALVEESTYKIYQIPESCPDEDDFSFARWDDLEKMGRSVNIADYTMTYVGKYTDQSLEWIYTKFNMYRPDDFESYSLSVGDVIVLHKDGTDTAFYVDSHRFVEVPGFFDERIEEDVKETGGVDLTDIDEEAFGKVIVDAINAEDNSFYDIGKSVLAELVSYNSKEEFDGMNKMMVAITGYNLNSIIKLCGEEQRSIDSESKYR